MDMPSYKTKQSGFSLIEALVGTVILAVVVVALTRLQVTMLADSSESRINTHALNYANEKLEEMRAFSRYDVFQSLANGSDSVNEDAGGAMLSRSWTVTDQGGYLQASVSVDWTDSRGASQSVELTSFISETDPVRSGKVLLAGVTMGGGTGSGIDTGTDNGDTDTGNSGGDTDVGDSTDTGDSNTGDGDDSSDDSSAGGGGSDDSSSTPALVLANYQECMSSPCSVGRKSTVVIGFTLGDGVEFANVVASGQAVVKFSGNTGVTVAAPNGNNKSFTVTITVRRANGVEASKVLKFTT